MVGSGLWSIPARAWEGGSTVGRGGGVSFHIARDTDSGILLTFWKPFRLDPCRVLHSSTALPRYFLANLPLSRKTVQDMAYE